MKSSARMATLVEDYLACRRRLGFGLKSAGRQLMDFARFADQSSQVGPLNANLAVSWAQSAPRKSPVTWARRLEVVRPFAKYLKQFDTATEVPTRNLCGRPHRRLTPHIYTDEEIRDLLTAAAGLPPKNELRADTYQTLFGLIAATGLRLSEALNLRRSDVDLDRDVLTIRETKFRKSRLILLHPTVSRELQRYAMLRDRKWPVAPSDQFFLSMRGRRVSDGSIEYVFASLRTQLGWTARGNYPAPRIQDLRHTFNCRQVLLWYQQGVNVDNELIMLSTYVGHANVTDTYWYITGIPELMAIATQRFEQFSQRGVHV